MASSSIESAATYLGNLLVEEVKFLADVKEKVEDLQSELEWMQCFLLEVDVKQNKNALLRKWVLEIKDLALDAEDFIETYILKVSHKKQNKGGLLDDLKWLSCCMRDAKTLHNVGSDIDALSAKISKMSSRLERYGVKSSYDRYLFQVDMDTKLITEQRRTYPHVEYKDIVGRQESVEEVVNRLQDDQHKIVLVHGMGGIGKTTLAREVFSNKTLKDEFHGFAWAYISQKLAVGPVCREILLQLIPVKNDTERDTVCQLQDDSLLVQKLCAMLTEKKYLVVLDDVWSTNDWKLLEPAFPLSDDTSNGSKLLITTRNSQIVSTRFESSVFYYELTFLDRGKSRQLLYQAAKFIKEITDSRMVELGDKMLNHCNGHPLAIVVLGGILASKKSVEEWQSISDNLPSHLRARDEPYSGVYEVLAMSYYDLPYSLKPCFLHLGNFPEDYYISMDKLYDLWISEGIVSSALDRAPTKRSLEDICEVYLNELVQRAMVQVASRDSSGKIRTCRLHDLMRDKCLEINSRLEHYLQIFDYPGCKSEDEPTFDAPGEKLRRMTIYVDHEIPNPLPKTLSGATPPLRSLLFFCTDRKNEIEDLGCIEDICKEFQLLRVLVFQDVPLKGCFPKQIGTLIFLRYLSLQDTSIAELPSSIENLRSLMILDLRVTYVTIKVPNLIWKITSLRHLYLPHRTLSREAIPSHQMHQGYEIKNEEMLKLDQLSHLEKLEDVDLDRIDVTGLAKLRNMRKLSAICVSKKENLEPFLKSTSIDNLSLKVHAGIITEDPMILSACNSLKVLHINAEKNEKIHLPMTAATYPQNLVELGFWYCKFQQDPLPLLGTLAKLKSLELRICYMGREMVCPENAFPELTTLVLDGLFCLSNWVVKKGDLPKLQFLEIHNSQLTMIPDALPSNTSIACNPCLRGIELRGTCGYFNGW